MGMFDKIRKKAEQAVDQHGDKIAKGIDKAAATASQKTGGKYDDKIAKGTASAKSGLDKLRRPQGRHAGGGCRRADLGTVSRAFGTVSLADRTCAAATGCAARTARTASTTCTASLTSAADAGSNLGRGTDARHAQEHP